MSDLAKLDPLNPFNYLFDPWDKEILRSQRGVGYQITNPDQFGARQLNYLRHMMQERVELLWCFKHMWSLDIPELNDEKFKKFEPRGLLLQQRLRLCIQCHWYYKTVNSDVTYRDAGHWFEECRVDSNQETATSIFAEPEQKRGSKKANIEICRERLHNLQCGDNPYSANDMPNFWTLIEVAQRFGHKDNTHKIPDIANAWTAYLKAYSAYITFMDRSPDVGHWFLFNNQLMLQQGKGNAVKEIMPKQTKTLNRIYKKPRKLI